MELVFANEIADPFSQARQLTWSGDFEQALIVYDALIAEYPDDVDYLFGRAQVLGHLGRDEEALVAAKRARELAPNYDDIWRFEISLLNRLPRNSLTHQQQQIYDLAAAKYPDEDWWRRPVANKNSRFSLTLAAVEENLTDGMDNWSKQYLSLASQPNDMLSWFAQIDRDERFGEVDMQMTLGGEYATRGPWYTGLQVSTTPDDDFQPRNAVALYVGKSLPEGWGAQLGWKQRRFDSAIVSTYTGTLERYFSVYRAAYSLNASRLHGGTDTYAHSFSFNWYYRDTDNVGFIISDGEEAESIAPGQVLESDVMSISVTGRQQLNEQLRLNWWIGSHEQGDFYRRRYVGLALTIDL